MSINKLILLMAGMLIGLSTLLMGCSTSNYNSGLLSSTSSENNVKKGIRYLLGHGVEQDDQRAFYYFNLAAQEDDPFAQNELAYMYAAGKGTFQDKDQAFKWYGKAAQHGLASAQYNYGLMHLNGYGTPVNKAAALEWFEKSATTGFEPAIAALKAYR